MFDFRTQLSKDAVKFLASIFSYVLSSTQNEGSYFWNREAKAKHSVLEEIQPKLIRYAANKGTKKGVKITLSYHEAHLMEIILSDLIKSGAIADTDSNHYILPLHMELHKHLL